MKEFINDLRFGLTERGNTSLYNPESGAVVFYSEIPDEEDQWLEIAMTPENYPAWSVSIIEKSKSELITHIEEELCDNWQFQRNYIGANVVDNSPIALEYVIEAVYAHLYDENPDYATNDTVTVIHKFLESNDWTLDISDIDEIRRAFDDGKFEENPEFAE